MQEQWQYYKSQPLVSSHMKCLVWALLFGVWAAKSCTRRNHFSFWQWPLYPGISKRVTVTFLEAFELGVNEKIFIGLLLLRPITFPIKHGDQAILALHESDIRFVRVIALLGYLYGLTTWLCGLWHNLNAKQCQHIDISLGNSTNPKTE